MVNARHLDVCTPAKGGYGTPKVHVNIIGGIIQCDCRTKDVVLRRDR